LFSQTVPKYNQPQDMEISGRVHILGEEIREIVKENTVYLSVPNDLRRDSGRKEQHERRRLRLEAIKTELETLIRKK
jgi:hypothetical protein